MGGTLDCSSFESAKKSVAKIFGTDESRLICFLAGIQPFSIHEETSDFVFEEICGEFGEPKGHTHTIWFHGTRAINGESFHAVGILPKSAAKNYIKSILLPMSFGFECDGENPFSLSLAFKQTEADEGPFAVLIKDAAIFANGSSHSYIEAPEMVEDIAGCLLGANFTHLVNRFQEATRPFVISFVESAKDYELRCATWYLYLIAIGGSTVEAANSANTCFDGMGCVISPDKFKAVEEIVDV